MRKKLMAFREEFANNLTLTYYSGKPMGPARQHRLEATIEALISLAATAIDLNNAGQIANDGVLPEDGERTEAFDAALSKLEEELQ